MTLLSTERLSNQIFTYSSVRKPKEPGSPVQEVRLTHEDIQKRKFLEKKLGTPSFQEKPKL